MEPETESVILTKSQAACLEALRDEKGSKTKIAITAKLDLPRTLDALESLGRLRLVGRDDKNRWRITQRGRKCSYETTPDGRRRGRKKPGPGAQRLLKVLDRPMRASKLAECLGITQQRVHQLAVKLHALGYIRFGDQAGGFSLIARRDDPTELLSRDEERVLSTVPDEYATGTAKIRSAARISEELADDILARLLATGLIIEVTGPRGERLYRITAAGLAHPQHNSSARRAELPRLPVKSDRVFAVLSSISDNGQVRIKDASQMLGVPRGSVNALFQYLKRRSLVRKIDQQLHAPFTLTDEGHRVLVELIRRRAA